MNSYDLLLALQSGQGNAIVALVRPEKMPQLVELTQSLIQSAEDVFKFMPDAVRERLTQES